MSPTSLGVVFSTSEPARSSAAFGLERPEPRWSKTTMSYASGSKKRRLRSSQPAPGPPCKKTHGMPAGLPQRS